MNIETREIRDVSELSEAEKQSGKWIPIGKKWARKYEQKQPVTDADFARIQRAHDRWQRRRAKRTPS